MNKERLTRMEQLLRRDAANPEGIRFDLSNWASPTTDGLDTIFWDTIPESVPVSCDTTACAIGLAALSGEFEAEGLTYTFVGWKYFSLIPRFNEQEGFCAAADLFAINYSDACYLFDSDCYGAPMQNAEGELFVADRIRDFIDGRIDGAYYPEYAFRIRY